MHTTHRIRNRPNRWALWLSGASALLIVIGLCPVPSAAQQGSDTELVWPPAPETARIQYVGYVNSARDVGKKSGWLGWLKRAVLGGHEEIQVLVRPHDVHADTSGKFYVTDRAGGGRILRIDPAVRELQEFVPEGAGRLAKPMGLGGHGENLYVADSAHKRIVALNPDGELLQAFGGAEVLLNPVDVAVATDGEHVYVVDSYLHQLLIFAADGTLIRRVGRDEGDLADKRERTEQANADGERVSESSDLVENRGDAEAEFHFPGYVAVSTSGNVFVSDCMNFRIQVFDAEGNYLREIGELGRTPGSFARPKGVGVDEYGHVYVNDAAFNNVQMFDEDGRLLMAFGAVGGGHGEFWQPLGMGVTGNRVFVVDRFNNRVQIFDYLHVESETEQSAEASSSGGTPRG